MTVASENRDARVSLARATVRQPDAVCRCRTTRPRCGWGWTRPVRATLLPRVVEVREAATVTE
jgi:hypothetical protein